MRFRSMVELGGKTATGIEVPASVVEALGSGRRPSVRITVGAHTYRTTVAVRQGRFLVPLSAENRTAAGVAAGDELDVDLELDEAPREVVVPPDLQQAFEQESQAQSFFDRLAFSHRKEWVRWIEEAKKPETRQRRVENTVAALRDGRRTP
ncbi:MAG TPA: YdeI/OmpD-associated family protein [Frankiaceae bacterium]|nr:YdeI/OmpD-associated family protein [Frankiaceae bacterium]